MAKFKDLTGCKFGLLTVIKRVENKKKNGACWQCECECGGTTVATTSDLNSGKVKSCGCLLHKKSPRRIDLTGRKFGKLTVIECAEQSNNGHLLWKCACDCGNEVIVDSNKLQKGNTASCGCLRIDVKRRGGLKHGMSHSRLYSVWKDMKYRCNNPSAPNYKHYGGRGIKVCDEWQTFEPFYNWAMSSGYNPDAQFAQCTIDRIDVNGDYEPLNCRWVDMKTQRNNQR